VWTCRLSIFFRQPDVNPAAGRDAGGCNR